jgi:hypothetical protein
MSAGKAVNLQQIFISPSITPVQMFARRQVRKFLQMFRPQGFRNSVLFAEPFSQVDQLATF